MIPTAATPAVALLTGQEPRPLYRLTLGGQDITSRLQGRLCSLTLEDNQGFEADRLDLELDDADGLLDLPERGAHIAVAIGWAETGLVEKGTFKVDELQHSGPPDRLTIRARSADLDAGLTAPREQSYRGQTVGSIVRTVAARYNLPSVVSDTLADRVVEHLDQTNESDANLLTRLARDFDAIATVKNGKLLFIRAGTGTTASGKPLPVMVITRQAGDRHEFGIANRENYNGVKAYYYDVRRAQKGEVVIDASNAAKPKPAPAPATGRTGRKADTPRSQVTPAAPQPNADNIMVLRHTYATKSNAERAARAQWQRILRGMATFSITLARGRPDLFSGLPVEVRGWKPQIDSTGWIIKRAAHAMGDQGYTTALDLEIKPDTLEETGTDA